MLKNLLISATLLATSPVFAGEVRPLVGNEPPQIANRIFCATETDVLVFLNTFSQDVLSRTRCTDLGQMMVMDVTPEYRFMDDQGDLTIIYSINDTPFWTYFFAKHVDSET